MRFWVVLLCCLSGGSFAWEGLERDISSLRTDVLHLWSGGQWQDEHQGGFYRIIVAGGGYEHVKTQLYVQWLSDVTDTEPAKVVATASLSQFNDNPLYVFELPSCVEPPACKSFILQATHTYAFTDHQFVLKFNGIGKYEITEVTK